MPCLSMYKLWKKQKPSVRKQFQQDWDMRLIEKRLQSLSISNEQVESEVRNTAASTLALPKWILHWNLVNYVKYL